MSKWGGPIASKIDAYFSLSVGFLAIAMCAVLIQPVKNNEASDRSICEMAFDISWPNVDADIDLWAQGPNTRPVGYSSKNSGPMDLVRDDLGYQSDKSNKNEERICIRAIVPGEYTINAHVFAVRGNNKLPLPVSLTVSKVDVSSAYMTEIYSKTVDLKQFGEELTIVRFTLKDDGSLDSSSIHDIPKKLRVSVDRADVSREGWQ